MKLGLELFIKRRFLSDDNTLQKFTKGRSTGLSGAFETRYKGELRNLVLSRIMVLVFFLDRAKASNVLENVPRLFTISSNVKSTRDVLVTICRDCLSAEGDIVKHLSRIGLKISYIQDPVDEVNFRVTNLATDVRDGVLLTRLSEIVTGKPFKSSMSSLRLPAVSRLQKKFNVNLAFSAIKDFGITIAEGINAHHIMDGHREMVLALMWCIIAHCCLDKLLHGDQVEQEIRNVIQSSLARKKLDGRSFAEVEQSALQPAITSVPRKDSSANGILKDILLRWSQAVCSSFGVAVNDLSESFADGKALCLLVHYYHPSLIHLDEIFPESGIGFVSEEEVLAKERVNWKKASKSMRELGGIPDMLPICDSENPPNEQSMLLCLSYLCSRLMESSREIFATILIQACYRKYRRKVLMEKKFMAAKSIFRIWTLNKDNYFRQQEERFKISVATLENFVLSHKHALKRMKKARLEKDYLTRSVTDIQVSLLSSLVLFERVYFRSFPHFFNCSCSNSSFISATEGLSRKFRTCSI
jgi:abnormal spindle-like microcephaly-associated protein